MEKLQQALERARQARAGVVKSGRAEELEFQLRRQTIGLVLSGLIASAATVGCLVLLLTWPEPPPAVETEPASGTATDAQPEPGGAERLGEIVAPPPPQARRRSNGRAGGDPEGPAGSSPGARRQGGVEPDASRGERTGGGAGRAVAAELEPWTASGAAEDRIEGPEAAEADEATIVDGLDAEAGVVQAGPRPLTELEASRRRIERLKALLTAVTAERGATEEGNGAREPRADTSAVLLAPAATAGRPPAEEGVEQAAHQALAIARAWAEEERRRAVARAACARAAPPAARTAPVVVEVAADRSGHFRFAGRIGAAARPTTGAAYRYACTRRDGRVEARPLGR